MSEVSPGILEAPPVLTQTRSLKACGFAGADRSMRSKDDRTSFLGHSAMRQIIVVQRTGDAPTIAAL